MLTVEQNQKIRDVVKAAQPGSPLYVSYHAGDGKNRHDIWETVTNEDGTSHFIDGIEQRRFKETTFSDAGGDIDAILSELMSPSNLSVWKFAVRSADVRAAVDVGELFALGDEYVRQVDFVLQSDVLDFTNGTTRLLFVNIGPKTKSSISSVCSRPGTKLDELDIVAADGLFVSSFPAQISRIDVFDALYEQFGETVRKR